MNEKELAELQEIKGHIDTVTSKLIRTGKYEDEESVKQLQIKFTEEFNNKHSTKIGWVTFYVMLDSLDTTMYGDQIYALTEDRMLEELNDYIYHGLKISGKL